MREYVFILLNIFLIEVFFWLVHGSSTLCYTSPPTLYEAELSTHVPGTSPWRHIVWREIIMG